MCLCREDEEPLRTEGSPHSEGEGREVEGRGGGKEGERGDMRRERLEGKEERIVMGEFGPEVSLHQCDSQSSGIFSQVSQV